MNKKNKKNGRRTAKVTPKIREKAKLTFFRLGSLHTIFGGWFADVKGVDLANNAMVAGADSLLEFLANSVNTDIGNTRRVVADIRTKYVRRPKLRLSMVSHDKSGATYLVRGADGTNLGNAWICNVTHKVLGEHPKNIYIKGFKVSAWTEKFRKHIADRYGVQPNGMPVRADVESRHRGKRGKNSSRG